MKKTTLQCILEDIQETEIEIGIRSYSGRGMYGDECLAFTTDRYTSLGKVFAEILFRVTKFADTEVNEIAACFRGIQSDSMGMGMVYYFPDVEYVDNEDEPVEDNED